MNRLEYDGFDSRKMVKEPLITHDCDDSPERNGWFLLLL